MIFEATCGRRQGTCHPSPTLLFQSNLLCLKRAQAEEERNRVAREEARRLEEAAARVAAEREKVALRAPQHDYLSTAVLSYRLVTMLCIDILKVYITSSTLVRALCSSGSVQP